MNLPPRLTNKEIDRLVDMSLITSEEHPGYYEGHLYATNVPRPMFQLLSLHSDGIESEDYWHPDSATWFADGRPDPEHSLDDEDIATYEGNDDDY